MWILREEADGGEVDRKGSIHEGVDRYNNEMDGKISEDATEDGSGRIGNKMDIKELIDMKRSGWMAGGME